ncbi:MAG: molybdopterin-dependent oxidoreductase [Chloroflexi bacterium]|nr:molybdopterin-dependent oxidoreductase [Chloroflexota bacterium]
MVIHITINGQSKDFVVGANETLMSVLRRESYYSVKHGCETGDCGACGVLMRRLQTTAGDAAPQPFAIINTCVLLAAQVDGAEIVTVESLGDRKGLSVIQQCFIDNGAIQCGFCTPAQMLAAKALLDKTPTPTEDEVRDAISGVLCRCTGYLKPVQAILNAAARISGKDSGAPPSPFKLVVPNSSPVDAPEGTAPGIGAFRQDIGDLRWGNATGSESAEAARPETETQIDMQSKTGMPEFVLAPEPQTVVVGKAEKKVDAAKLAQGKPAFVDDAPLPGMLHAALLTSPHAHARIVSIDATKARALPGVHAVLTHHDVPRVIYASGGQSYPNPPPWDQVSLDNKVRHVGDRVAVVAAETYEIARRACELIEVEYEVLPAVFDPDEAMKPGAPMIHDEPDAVAIRDASRNLVHYVKAQVGDVDKALAESDWTIEREYRVQQVQQVSIEPHICMTWFDEDDRLVIRTSTQVPFHVRRMVAPLIGLPVKKIRVVKPRVGGGFGGKQEMLIEDLCAHLTLATDRPVRFELTREEEFTSSRSRHPQRMVFKLGFKKNPDGGAPILHALSQYTLGNTGAYGTHGLTVQTVSGLRGTAQYRCPNMKFECHVVYTNIPTPGAFRGYGAPQAEFGLECAMDEAAQIVGADPVELRRQNWVRAGDALLMARQLGEGREGFDQIIRSCGLEECFQQALAAVDWDNREQRRIDPARPHIRRGVGVAVSMHGTAIAGLDMGAASIKMNDDGSFNVLVGGTDIGTGSDTVVGQIVAETLGIPLEDVIMYSSDTDFTPFDTGAYASSTTYITGGAAKKAAEQVREQIREVAVHMFLHGRNSSGKPVQVDAHEIVLRDRMAMAPDGSTVGLGTLALFATHQENQHQIMATASHMSYDSPPPFACQVADVEVDIETGEVRVLRLVQAVDCGVAINPATASGQIEGGNIQALGYALSEEMVYDADGKLLNPRIGPYRIYAADEIPELQAILVQTYEPSGPYGAKAVAEIPMDGVAPAVVNAVYDATGVRFHQIPLTPERVWRGLNMQA